MKVINFQLIIIIFQFYKLCDKWKKEVKKNPMTKYELNKYKTSPEVYNMLMQVSCRIGLNYTLSFGTYDFSLMYKFSLTGELFMYLKKM